MPNPVYSNLLEQVTDKLKQKILDALLSASEKSVRRENLVFSCFGISVSPKALASSHEDRAIRKAIEKLRDEGWPILSTSGGAGYRIGMNEADVMDFYHEQWSRGENTLATAKKALTWLPKAKAINEARITGQAAIQPKLI